MYALDTGHFFSSREKYLNDRNFKYRKEHNYVKNKLSDIEKRLYELGYSPDDVKSNPEYDRFTRLMQHKKEKAKAAKEKLLDLLANKIVQNERTCGKDHIRSVRESDINDTNMISVFDSSLSRAIGISQGELTDALIVVQVFYLDVFKDISFYGFVLNGEKYKYFTSSAGQIRTKKAVFMKETVWNKIEKQIMCGLTIDKINLKGGNNVNKHLAYMALANSATDEWDGFDIDRTVVIEDFETDVYGTFDFVDETDYSITRKTGYVPIPHTDGAGMILPSVSDRNFMFRAPWIKGLLGVFDFRRFITENRCSPVILDIYGREHHVIEEDIQIIFTKSQFKMYKYYDSWDEYKEFFKKYRCSAGRCNIEEDRIKNAKINYQMLQTLTDITEDEIDLLTRKSADRIRNICTSEKTMMEILGITPYNTRLTPFQKAVKRYPALLNDTYAKDIIREAKDSLLKKYRSGKLEVTGKYTFLLPDFYAACEYWFGHIDRPQGLLADQEVFCWLFKRYEKLDCLRSPHLYKEHAVRLNIANDRYGDRAEQIREWFPTNALYTSTHDLISKILQFDVDGDKSLVVADQNFVSVAERNMEGIVPLYYNMKKAEPTELNNKTIYAGLNKAFTSGNIGLYSNEISKIWNHDIFINGTGQEKQEAVDIIKLLCMENNFCIDSAKTLYMPKRAKWFQPAVSRFTGCKLPAFFEFAKDKETFQVQARNGSFVNRIYDKIPNQTINTRGLMLGQIDYKLLMGNGNMVCSKEVSTLYDQLNKKYRHMMNRTDEYNSNLEYIANKIRDTFRACGYSDETIADMLVSYLYGKGKRYKQLLWFCYGQYIVNHMEKNIKARKTRLIQCTDCGEWIEVDGLNSRSRRCEACQHEETKRIKREYKTKKQGNKTGRTSPSL